MSVERIIPVPSLLKVIIQQELSKQQGALFSDVVAENIAAQVLAACTVPLAGLRAPIDPQIDLLNRKLAAAQACLEMQTEMVQQYANLYGALPKRA